MFELITISRYIFAGIFLFIAGLRLIYFLHILQLQGYRSIGLIKWHVNNPLKIFSLRPIKNPKKKLVFTARATRVFVLSLILSIYAISLSLTLPFWAFAFTTVLVAFSAFLVLILSNIMIYPLESIINNFYIMSAKKRIRQLKPNVIAITGSFGKTSTKDILAHILSARYRVLKTPGSFNTPMGLCKVIRHELRPEHEIFIVEMGARRKGDIKELCDLVGPEIGIITAIGPQHLETFKTLENIIDTKYELIESLPTDGIAVFNGDDENCVRLAERTTNKKVLLYGVNKSQLCFDKSRRLSMQLSASKITMTTNGLTFIAKNGKGHEVVFQSNLLGRHNVSNILAATVVSLELGMTLDEISERLKTLQPTPHRLQLIHGIGGVTVLDDAFNANPVGAKIALEILAEFKGCRKILVTPGFVELGDKEEEENMRLGLEAAKVCDVVFLVGPKRTRPICEGLKKAGFPETNIFVEKKLSDVTERFKNILKTGDVVLFENDLPDNYNE